MDHLSFLIIKTCYELPYYNWESIRNATISGGDYVGYSLQTVKNCWFTVIRENIVAPISESLEANYFLTEKGKDAYLAEQKIRKEAQERAELDKAATESTLETNRSVLATNASVQETNKSVQELNRITTLNYTTQNRFSRASTIVAIAAVLVALLSFLQGIFGSGNAEIEKQLQKMNTTLQQQNEVLKQMLERQTRIDSMARVKDTKSNR